MAKEEMVPPQCNFRADLFSLSERNEPQKSLWLTTQERGLEGSLEHVPGGDFQAAPWSPHQCHSQGYWVSHLLSKAPENLPGLSQHQQDPKVTDKMFG